MIRKISFLSMVMFIAIQVNSQSFNNPESIVYDTITQQYFVSNVGNNTIVTIDKSGSLSDFVTSGLDKPKGILVIGDTIISANNTAIHGYSASDASELFKYSVEGAQFMNDITADGAGNIYISDMNKQSILKMKLSTGAYEELASTVDRPNGVLYLAESNTVLICYWGSNAKIQSLDLSDNTISDRVTTRVSDLDGMAQDNCGNIYVSSWGVNAILVFDPSFSKPHTNISRSHSGPADISIDAQRQLLLIPNFNSNTIDSLELNQNCDVFPQLSAPVDGSADLDGNITLDWNDTDGATSYVVEYGTNETLYSSTTRVDVNESEYVIDEPSAGETYFWRVRAVGTEGKSMFDAVWSFETKESAVNTNNISKGNSVYSYPNPVVDELNFKNTLQSVKLINTIGQTVFSQEGYIDRIDISSLEKGVYFIELHSQDGEFARETIIKN